MRRLVRYLDRFVLLLFASAALASCVFEDYVEEEPVIKRTILVYMAAENDLSKYVQTNMRDMRIAVKGMDDVVNLLVYVDRRQTGADSGTPPPVLIHIHNDRYDTVRVFEEHNSCDPVVFGRVVEYVNEKWSTDSFGLVLWSHGTGWVPGSQMHYVAPNLNYVQPRDGDREWDKDDWYPWFPGGTRYFGRDEGAPSGYKTMNVSDMAKYIQDQMFDFIMFDACYMGNVELVYELRNKTKYIISSASEIMGEGFPYIEIMQDLAYGNLTNVCRGFYKHYLKFSGFSQLGCVSLVRTEGLDSLASCFGRIVAGSADTIPYMDTQGIQLLDRFKRHVFYDLADFVGHVANNNDLIEFKNQLNRCVIYKATTPYLFKSDSESSINPYEIKMNTFCGLSVYIPLSVYEDQGLNDDYRKLKWSKITGYGKAQP